VSQGVAGCCRVLQGVAAVCKRGDGTSWLPLQVCHSVVQGGIVWQGVAVWKRVWQGVAGCCRVLQDVAVCCSREQTRRL